MKKILTLLLSCILVFCSVAIMGCGGNSDANGGGTLVKPSEQEGTQNKEEDNKTPDTDTDDEDVVEPEDSSPVVVDEEFSLQPVSYSVASFTGDVNTWANKLDNNAVSDPGIIVSPYFTLKINNVDVPVFAERTARGPHSFAYVDVTGIDKVEDLTVTITTHENRVNPIVLPEKTGVQATVSGTTVTAKITDYGNYTFTFDKGVNNSDGSNLPLTIMVKHYEAPVVPSGYQRVEFEGGSYSRSQFNFSESSNKFYYFKRGLYNIEQITLGSNMTLYFEAGCVFVATIDADNKSSIILSCNGQENVKVIGHAAFDFSPRQGETSLYQQSIHFRMSKNITLSGINCVNSGAWTVCFSSSTDIVVKDIISFAYRTFSDGIMLSNCQNANVSGCFIRTGDDGMEIKSTTAGGISTNNVVFEYNDVWTDKGIAYGAVYESCQNQNNVYWRHNSVGYALADWEEHLACATICICGDENQEVVNQNLHFEDLEIYTTYCAVINVCLHSAGTVRNIYYNDIRAKFVELNGNFRKPIDFMVHAKDMQSNPVTVENFEIGRLFFDDILIEGNFLTDSNRADMVSTDFAEGFVFDMDNLKINKSK